MDPGRRPSLKTTLRELARRWEGELTDHPTSAELAAYLDGELPPADQERLRDHLAVCRPCTRLVRDLAAAPDLEVPDAVAQKLDSDVEAGWEALQGRLAGRAGDHQKKGTEDRNERSDRSDRQEQFRERLPLFRRRQFLPFGYAAALYLPLLGRALAARYRLNSDRSPWGRTDRGQ